MEKHKVTLKKENGNLYAEYDGWRRDMVQIRERNGVVQIANYSSGGAHSGHPNIDRTGSVSGMKKLGYWRKDAETVRAHGCIYNMSVEYCSDALDAFALAIEKGRLIVPALAEGERADYEFEA
jgi:hypothetical protein